MDMIYKSWKVVSAWWAKLPKQKWIALGVMAIMLMAAGAKVFGQEQQAGTFYLGEQGGVIIQCKVSPNNDGIHVCAALHTGQRGYCIAVPANRFPADPGAWWCTGNQPGNKTYDKALLLKDLIDGPDATLEEVDQAATAWDEKYPPQVALPGD